MSKTSVVPEVPEKGFYYHYKHDPNGPVNNFAYEFLLPVLFTENWFNSDFHLAIYRPLYEDAKVYKMGKWGDARPLEMFMETVTLSDNSVVPRFRKITDTKVIVKLEKIRDSMY